MEDSGQPHVLAVLSRRTATLPIELEVWWAPEYVWAIWRTKIIFNPCRDSNCGLPRAQRILYTEYAKAAPRDVIKL
jgi:hypothetical protein